MKTLTGKNQMELLRRAGLAGFVFFFVKGMLWLAAPFVFYWFA